MLSNGTRGLILLLGMTLLHCADATKYQAEYRGSWGLESRKNAQGQEMTAPEISGILEWFPTAKEQAHVLVTISTSQETMQASERVYDLSGNSFTARSNLQIGGLLGTPIDATYEASSAELSGQIKSEDARVVLTHSDGTEYEFIGAQLIVTYKNGIVDRWKRLRDQKGTLAK